MRRGSDPSGRRGSDPANRRSIVVSAAATSAAESTAEVGLDDIKRVLDHESAELFRESQPNSRGSQRDSSSDDFQLGEVLDELLRTEANYMRDMRFTVAKFAKPLRELLDAAQMQSIFSNLATIVELHANLSEVLPQPGHILADDDAGGSAWGGP